MRERARKPGSSILRGTALLVLGCLLIACGGGSAEPTPTATAVPTSAPQGTPVPRPDPTSVPTATPPAPSAYPAPIQAAINAAAEEAGVSPEEVVVLSYARRDWPSTALGCPRPGFSYAQVVTAGFEVHLEAGGERYAFHTNTGTTVVLCQAER